MIEQLIKTNPPYSVRIGSGLLSSLSDALPNELLGCKIAVIADETVDALYGTEVQASLSVGGYEVYKFTFLPGEKSKTLLTLGNILEFLAEKGLDRSDTILALGGGVTGDLAGFAAATYLRGIRFIQVPTTLLAAVDSSVGGKTAVNLSKGKNLAGAFWQPTSVVCDTDTFKTLPSELYAEGIAEAVKCGMIGDVKLFDLLRQSLLVGGELETEIIWRSIRLKADIVEEDEKEQGRRALLNFGHTLAHVLEINSGYGVRHGRAVALGMMVVTRAAERQGFAETGTLDKLLSVLNIHGYGDMKMNPDTLLEAIGSDKKKRGDRITLVLPRCVGCCELVSMPLREAKTFLSKGFI